MVEIFHSTPPGMRSLSTMQRTICTSYCYKRGKLSQWKISEAKSGRLKLHF